MNIYNCFDLAKQDGQIGVEIELEGENLPNIMNEYWNTVKDGSLKGKGEGKEYVMNSPLSLKDLLPVLKDFQKRFDKTIVYNSYYAGIHVHANVQQLTPRQLVNLLTILIIVEDLLVKWCGPTREGNHFCLRTSDTDYLINFIVDMVQSGEIKRVKNNDNIRYSAFNLKSIAKYGSLEFRSLASTIDADRIYKWCEVIVRLIEEAKKWDSPDLIVTEISAGGYGKFLSRVFGDNEKLFRYDGCERDLRFGVIRAQDIAFCKDWRSFNLNVFKSSKEVF